MRKRRAVTIFISSAVLIALLAGAMPALVNETISRNTSDTLRSSTTTGDAAKTLETLPVKGRAPKTGYERAQFGDGWATTHGCTTRNIILNRDLHDVVIDNECRVVSGVLYDPYTGETIAFTKENSSAVQIDHVIALSDAWQKGAQLLTPERRVQLANDPLELLAVQDAANQAKIDADAATWLPSNKAFRCAYVARQIAIKVKYSLWVTQAEKDAMSSVLKKCPGEPLPSP